MDDELGKRAKFYLSTWRTRKLFSAVIYLTDFPGRGRSFEGSFKTCNPFLIVFEIISKNLIPLIFSCKYLLTLSLSLSRKKKKKTFFQDK